MTRLVDRVKTTNAIADEDAHAVCLLAAEVKPRVFYRHPGRGDDYLAEPSHPSCLFMVEVVARLEALDLAGDLAGVSTNVAEGDGSE